MVKKLSHATVHLTSKSIFMPAPYEYGIHGTWMVLGLTQFHLIMFKNLLHFALNFWRKKIGVVDPHHLDADPDPTFHPDADPDSDQDADLSFQIKAQSLEKVLK